MVVHGVSTSIDVDIDDLLTEMSDTEKVDLMVELMNEHDVTSKEVADAIEKSLIDADNVVQVLKDKGIIEDDNDDEPVIATCVEVYGVDFDSCNGQEDFISKVLEKMTPYELKKALCNALWVDNYNHESMLREKLEKIITAK